MHDGVACYSRKDGYRVVIHDPPAVGIVLEHVA